MKETPLSLCECSALISNLENNLRLDGRSFFEMRPIDISFGKDYGCCSVQLGETRVLAQVTCEVVEPRPSRPNEGKISIAVHISPMAAPHFEQGRGNEFIDELQQILDRNIKESRCVDVESLCILAEESVWQFKVDVTVLNHAGNLGDACNLAAVAALRHFHRPDVTVEEDGRVTIHTPEERELIPTFLKKIPICLTYGLFIVNNECLMILDPTEKEERVMSGKFVVGLNSHGEITSLLFPGKVCLEKDKVISCVFKSFAGAKSFAEGIFNAVEEDLEKRKSSRVEGFTNALKSDPDYLKSLIMERIQRVVKIEKTDNAGEQEPMEVKQVVATPAPNSMVEPNEEVMDSTDSEDEFSQESLHQNLKQIRAQMEAKKISKSVERGRFDDNEEMETQTTILNKEDIG